MRALALLGFAAAGSAGCNLAFGLDETAPLADADPDVDRDGYLNAADNCPLDANDQHDDDGDGIGDACDRCPILEDTDQADFDEDRIGDACDPHPDLPGDCLVLFDSFTQGAALAAHWTFLADSGVTPPEPREDAIWLDPRGARASLLALDPSGAPFTGLFDVQLAATITIGLGAIHAVSNATIVDDGYRCGVTAPTPYLVEAGAYAASAGTSSGNFISAAPVGAALVLRLTASQALSSPRTVACRADYGYAVGLQSLTPGQQPMGSPGIALETDPALLLGLALYQFTPGTACPVPILR